jgi:hypothetical protein
VALPRSSSRRSGSGGRQCGPASRLRVEYRHLNGQATAVQPARLAPRALCSSGTRMSWSRSARPPTGDPLSSARKRRWHRLPRMLRGAADFVIVGAHRRVLAAPPRLQPINKGRGSRYGIRSRLNSRCSVSAIAGNAAVTASQPAISIPAASSSSFLRAVYRRPTVAGRRGYPDDGRQARDAVDARRYDCRCLRIPPDNHLSLSLGRVLVTL